MEIEGIGIDFLGHSGFMITNGKRIAIDPYNLSEKVDKADIILITHSHYDHCSIKDIEKISKQGTIIVAPADCQSKIAKLKNISMEIVEAGDSLNFGNMGIEAVWAYNLDKEFHRKSEGWLGYLVKIKGTIIYHAGDTDKIPEMQKLTGYGKHDNKFIILLPVSGESVMDSDEAAEVASLLNPDLAIPMHYGSGVAGTSEDAEDFARLCKGKNIKALVLEKV